MEKTFDEGKKRLTEGLLWLPIQTSEEIAQSKKQVNQNLNNFYGTKNVDYVN